MSLGAHIEVSTQHYDLELYSVTDTVELFDRICVMCLWVKRKKFPPNIKILKISLIDTAGLFDRICKMCL